MSINNITPSKFQCAVARCTLVLRFSTFFTPIFKAPGCSVSNDPPLQNRGPISRFAPILCPDLLDTWPS